VELNFTVELFWDGGNGEDLYTLKSMIQMGRDEISTFQEKQITPKRKAFLDIF